MLRRRLAFIARLLAATALAFRAANIDAFNRYHVDQNTLAAYVERWPEVRRQRKESERYWRLQRRATTRLAEFHRWPGAE